MIVSKRHDTLYILDIPVFKKLKKNCSKDKLKWIFGTYTLFWRFCSNIVFLYVLTILHQSLVPHCTSLCHIYPHKTGGNNVKKKIKKAVRRGSSVPISPDRTQTKYEALLIILSKWSNQLPVNNDFANILAKDSLNPIKAWLLFVLFYIDIKLLSSLCKDLFTRLIYKISALLNIK